MLFEDAHAGELVNQLRESFDDKAETSLQNTIRFGSLERIQEHSLVAGQRVLVHVRNGLQAG